MKRILIAALAVLIWSGVAGATATNGYRVSSTWAIGWDSSWVTDSAVLYVYRDFANDTAYKVINLTASDSIIGHAQEADSVARVRTGVWVPGTNVIGGYNPAFFAIWYLRQANGSATDERYDDSPKWTAQVVSTDSVDVGTPATVDYDTLASIVLDTAEARQPGTWSATGAAASGSGSEPVRLFVIDTSATPDTKINGAEIFVRNNPRTLVMGYGTTATGGFVDFQLDTATAAHYQVAVDLPGFIFRDSAWTGLSVPGGAQVDTLRGWTFSVTPASGADSCALAIYTDAPYCEAFFNIDQPKSGPLRDTSGVYLFKGEIRAEDSDGDGIITQTLIRGAATMPNCTYHIVVKTTSDKILAEWNKYKVPSSSSATLTAVE